VHHAEPFSRNYKSLAYYEGKLDGTLTVINDCGRDLETEEEEINGYSL
jgi:hypothetical protein